MRLIDADAFKDNFKAKTGIGRTMRNIIDEQPTAYDVDKVVERLEKSSTDKDGVICYIDKNPVITKEIAVEIVKSGVIPHPDSTYTDTGNTTADWKEYLGGRFSRFE